MQSECKNGQAVPIAGQVPAGLELERAGPGAERGAAGPGPSWAWGTVSAFEPRRTG